MADDGIRWRAHALVEKYSPDQVAYATALLGHDPDSVELHALFRAPEDGTAEAAGNLITELIIGGGGTSFAHASAIVGVGNSTTAAAIGDTALGADNTSNAYYQQADSSNPSQANGVITCVATFTTGNANFAWNEWCWATGSGGITAGTHLSAVATGVTMLNHKVQSLGTKSSGSWVLTATVTLQ